MRAQEVLLVTPGHLLIMQCSLMTGTLHFPLLQGEDVYTAAKLAMAELIMSGCTTTSDHLYIYPNDVMCALASIATRRSGSQHCNLLCC